MRISYEWLSDYVDTNSLSPHEAAEILTMSGTKIESVHVLDLSAIIVGRVLEQKDHPSWNKPRWIHQVDVGSCQVIQILDGEITPNRPDCLGHIGVARELGAAAGRDFKANFMPPYIEGVQPPAAELIDIAIEVPDLCSRFVAVPITGVKVAPSPDWVQRRLRAAGVRPISNVVDATAYVMLEHAKPTHVFDVGKLAGKQLHVREAREGESLLCLDGQTRKVGPGMLVVADANGPVAIGGIIGGEESGVSDTSTDVVIESAGWDGVDPPYIRQQILPRLGFQVGYGGQEGFYEILPPVFRLDVELPEDVIEEVGRIYGIERIPATLPGSRRHTWEVMSPEDHHGS